MIGMLGKSADCAVYCYVGGGREKERGDTVLDSGKTSWLKGVLSALLSLSFILASGEDGGAYPIGFTDSNGSHIVLSGRPQKVVSLVPGISRIIFALGAGDSIQGLTWCDFQSPETAGKPIVGGFLSPSIKKIEESEPDVVFLSSLHREARRRLSGGSCHLIELRSGSIEDICHNIETLGEIFEKPEEAEDLVRKLREKLDLVSRKVEKIPPEQRKRVLRLMGRDQVMTPGDDSFQNSFIRSAGGIPPALGKKGEVVDITLEEWRRFNPQVIYGCGGDKETADKFLIQPGWKDVEAVREGRIFYFPCELTCQASLYTGDFVAWLASTIYAGPFSLLSNHVLEEKRTGSKPIEVPLSYVQSAQVVESTLSDFPNKTLVVDFKKPTRITSTLDGERSGIRSVGNHGLPPPCWSLGHSLGLEGDRRRICKVVGKPNQSSCFLMTGANIDNLSVRKAEFKDMTAYALVTAGVRGNAARMASDEGLFYEPGTINIIVMTNRKLSPRARARAIICLTEAKTAALQDMDIRSNGSPLRRQATGTGTDEAIVVEGCGAPLDNTGGHCKMGELIAKAVYEGVKEAVFRQNGIVAPRNVLQRLQERGVSPLDLLRRCPCFESGSEATIDHALGMLEEILLEPRYAAFLESTLALSDAHERGQIGGMEAFELWARAVAEEIAGGPVKEWKELVTNDHVPEMIKISLNALLNGSFRTPHGPSPCLRDP